ncbi:unnamed protein product [Blepharisma stoltei]|uniref:TmcB/TmcC TPR repeats domain-containing protein n=1 Tax=Blepharisma stoltei TaxID=1481888 RepID=A0AAU9IVE1_9CILI|nr:unnamed protein product [Blepharisma stoltei]
MEDDLLAASNLKAISHTSSSLNWFHIFLIIKNSFFDAFSIIYSCQAKRVSPNNSNEKLLQIILSIIIYLQIARFNWSKDLNMNDYIGKNWTILSYLSIDQICADSGYLYGCFLMSSISVLICAIFVFLFSIISYQKLAFKSHIALIPKIIMLFLSTIGFIPSLVIFMFTLKNSISKENSIEEYSTCTDCNLNLGATGIVWSLINLILLPIIAYGREIFSAELRHTFALRSLKARAHSSIDIEMISFSIIISVTYVLISDYSYYFHQTILVLYSLYILYRILKYAPYYNIFLNALIFAKNSAILFTTLAFLFGNAIGDSQVTIVFFWLINPILIFISLNYAMKIIKEIGENTSYNYDQYNFELRLRKTLMDDSPSNPTSVLTEFSEATKRRGYKADKLFVIWESNYCFYNLGDERLGRVKFYKIFLFKPTIEGCFQEWAVSRLFEKNNIGVYEDVSTIYYFLELDSIKAKDELLCNKLIDFWNELTSSRPKIEKLNLIAETVSDTMDAVNNGYSKLVKNFPNRASCHDLYGSLQIDILGKQEYGSKLIMKRESLRMIDLQENKNKFSPFSENNGFIIISANNDSFGTIFYANSIAAHILKQTIGSIVGSKILTYIPEPYSKNHYKFMRRYIKNCVKTESGIGMPNVLQTDRGYLVECNFEFHLVSLIKNIYYVLAMKPVSKTREIALVSDDGIVQAHSESFLHYIESSKETGKNENISDLIPNLNFALLKSHVPVMIGHGNKHLLFVLIRTTLKSTSLNLLLLVHNQQEVEEWNRGEDEFQKEMNEVTLKNFQLLALSRSDLRSNTLSNSLYAINAMERANQNEEKDENKISEKVVSNTWGSSYSSLSFINYGEKKKKNAQIALKVTQWTLAASILAIIGMNIGILFYIKTEIQHSNDLSKAEHFASIMLQITRIAGLSRAIDFATTYNGLNTTFLESCFNTSLAILSSLQSTILADYDEWSYCSSSEMVTNEIIPIWTRDTLHTNSHYNFYDMVTVYLKRGNSFINNVKQGQNYSDDEFFLIVNGFGVGYQILNTTLAGLIDCEVDRINDDDVVVIVLISMGIAILGTLSAVLLILIVNFSRKYNEIWNFIRKQAIISYIELFQSCFNRLSTVLDCASDQQERDFHKINKEKLRQIREKFTRKLAAYFLLLISTSIVYYFVVGYVLYPACKSNLIKRNHLLEAYYVRVSQISEASYLAAELALGKNSPAPQILYPHFDMKDPYKRIFEVRDSYYVSGHVISSMKNRELFTSNLAMLFFEKVPNAKDVIFDIGTYPGALLLGAEYTYYGYSNSVNIVKELNKFLRRAWILQEMIRARTPIFGRDSMNYVDKQVSYVSSLTAFYGVFSFLLYCALYWPVIRKESNKLQKLYEISQLIPSATNKK